VLEINLLRTNLEVAQVEKVQLTMDFSDMLRLDGFEEMQNCGIPQDSILTPATQQSVAVKPPSDPPKKIRKREIAETKSRKKLPSPPPYNSVHNIVPSRGKVLDMGKKAYVVSVSPDTVAQPTAQPTAQATAQPVMIAPAPAPSPPAAGNNIQHESPTVSIQLQCLPSETLNIQMGFHPGTGTPCVVLAQTTLHGHISYIYLKTTDIPAMVFALVGKMMEK
jgi:hypothetical protein